MATLIGLFTLGRDIEARTTQSGEPVGNLSLAYNYGKKGADGKRPTQWIDGTLWGEQVNTLAAYLVKGAQFEMHVDDVHIETFQKRDGGEGVKLAGRVRNIEFTRGGIPDGGTAPAPAPAPQAAPAPPVRRPAPAPAPRASSGFDDMDDDIPF